MTMNTASLRHAAGRLVRPLGAVAGCALLVWLVVATGPAEIGRQLYAFGPMLPAVLGLTGLRHLLQAAGWRLAMPNGCRPAWSPMIRGTIAGEAVGYLAWGGPIARDPVKTLFVRSSVPVGTALTAAIVERLVYAAAALVLMGVATLLVVARSEWLLPAAAIAVPVAASLGFRECYRAPEGRPANAGAFPAHVTPARPTRSLRGLVQAIRMTTGDLWCQRRSMLLIILLTGLAQVALTVGEVYLILWWLGATPTLASALVFEAGTKLVGGVGMFVPGRIGIAEATSAGLAGALSLGPSYGVSLALARRVRGLLWGAFGLLLLWHHAWARRRHPQADPGDRAPSSSSHRADIACSAGHGT